MLGGMLAVLRPALAVLLLVGVGVAAVEDAACCADVVEDCSVLQTDDNEARMGGLAALVPDSLRLTRSEQPPLVADAPPPVVAARVADVLTAAPKTSPPA